MPRPFLRALSRPLSRRTLLRWTAAVGVCAGAPGMAGAPPLRVFAAASLKTALDEVISDYKAATGQEISAVYGGSSVLARQIQYGAPADLFVSANPVWMEVLIDDGLVRDQDHADLVSNRLVLICAQGIDTALRIAPGFDLAGALGDGYLAMALVDAVPAGIYGRQALTSLGVWDSVASQVAQADNVRAALRLVASGEAPYGVVYATDARVEPLVRLVDSFAPATHAPIVYPGALLRDAQPGAQAFWSYLSGPLARTTFLKHGFLPPGGGS